MNYNPDRVILLRQVERMTQKKLAEKTGIAQGTLSKLQNRQIDFTDEAARRISMATDYPLSFFLDQDQPVPIVELTYRHTSSASVGELNAIAAEYALLRSVAQKLSSVLRLQPKTSWIDAIAPRENELEQSRIERLADSTRTHLGLNESGSVPNLTRAIEKMGIVVAPLHALASKQTAHLNSDGVTQPNCKDMPTIGYSAKNNTGDRLRFTIAHELGHLILHRYRRPQLYREMEREAHRFASALLMPQNDAKLIMPQRLMLTDLVRLKAGWGMSISSMISRASNLGIIDADRTRSLQIQLSARGWRKEEPVHVGDEHPILLKQMIVAGYGDPADPNKGIDTFKAENSLNVPFRFLDQWADGLKEQGASMGFGSKTFRQADN